MTDPSLNEADYFSDYDNVVAAKKEVIIVAKSGKKAQYGKYSDLEQLLLPYAQKAESLLPGAIDDSPLEPMWVDIQYPTEATIMLLMKYFGIHWLTGEDCLMESEKAHQKFEIFDTYRFVSFAEHHVIPGTNIWSSIDVQMILPTAAPVLLAMHSGPVSYIAQLLNRIQSLSKVKSPLRSGKGVKKRTVGECTFPSPEWLMYAILDQIVDQFLGLVYECSVEITRLDEMLYVLPAREQTDFLRRIGAVRGRICVLRLQLLRKLDIVKSMILYASEQPISYALPTTNPQQKTVLRVGPHTKRITISSGMKNVRIFMRDIQDHIVAMMVDLEQGKEELGAIAMAFTSRVSIQISLADKEQNSLMKLFSALTTVVLPLTFVTALFGMNVPVVWGSTKNTKAFGGILGVLLLSGLIASIVFWRFRWL